MKIGVPTEIKIKENRVGLVPGGVKQLVIDGHEVFVQKGDQIGTKENIGKLLPKSNGISEAHFEIWKISSEGMNTENPAYWLSR